MFGPLAGETQFEIVSADIPGILTAINRASVAVKKVKTVDCFTICLTVGNRDVQIIKDILTKRCESYRMLLETGLQIKIKSILRRPVLLIGIVIILLLTVILPNRIYFVFVEGNSRLPTRYITEAAKKAGIHFGTLRESVRSERVKNTLLEMIPELQWVGVTTQGCTATIHIKEKNPVEYEENTTGIVSIIASKDGILDSCTVTRGRSLCKPGLAVKKGDLLISGFTNEGFITGGCQAEGEIYAFTKDKLLAITPEKYLKRTNFSDKHTCIGVRIGKKLINFCNHSGIYGVTCAKMYKEECWMLPGGLPLPIAWTFNTYVASDFLDCSRRSDADDLSWLSDACRSYHISQMTAGKILTEKVRAVTDNSAVYFYADYSCYEMIGQARQEEIIEHYAKDNGENSECRTR